MRGGFFRGLVIGTLIGSVSNMLMDYDKRQMARNMVDRSNGMIKMVQDKLETAGYLFGKGRRIFAGNDEYAGPVNMASQTITDNGKENITRRVAMLEKRLEELSQKGL